MTRHRLAVLGAGAMGRRHARVLSNHARFEVVGVLDLDDETSRAVCEEWGLPHLASEREAFDRAEAVVVATPIQAHAPMVRRALAARKHVLVEKPIAGRVSDARALLEVAEGSGSLLFVGHSERFNPVVCALAERVPPNDVLAMELRRLGAIRDSGARMHGALLNLGVHDLDLIAYLTKSALTLRHAIGRESRTARLSPHEGPEDVAHVLVRTGSGAAGHVYVDQRPSVRTRTIALTTRSQVFYGDLLTPSLSVTCRMTGVREAIALSTDEPLALQAQAFADALDGLPSEIATGFDGARALLAAERAMARMRVAPVASALAVGKA